MGTMTDMEIIYIRQVNSTPSLKIKEKLNNLEHYIPHIFYSKLPGGSNCVSKERYSCLSKWVRESEREKEERENNR